MRTWITLALLVSAALAGCAGEEGTTPAADPVQESDDGTNETATSTATSTSSDGPEGNGTGGEAANTPPTAELTADLVNGTAPLNVTFTLDGSDADGDALTWTLSVNRTQIADGEALPATVTYNFTEAGNHSVDLAVSDGSTDVRANLTVEVVPAQEEAAPEIETFRCTTTVGAVVISLTTGVVNIGGCSLTTTSEPRIYYDEEVPAGCVVHFDTDGDGFSDGTAALETEYPANTNFFVACDPGVVNAETVIHLAVLT